jgi:membrane-bound metal-dependent hydrolase YbcI (DUF457 family)
VDPVTHTLVGVGLANAFCRRRFGPEAVPILAIASNLPDLDAAVHLGGDPAALLLRRSFGHSLFLLPVWALLLAVVLKRFHPRHQVRDLFALSLLGGGVHLVFDLVNSFGVLLLWPLSDWRPEWAIVFIIDLALTGLLAAPLLLAAVPRLRPRLAAMSRWALAGVGAYLFACAAGRTAAATLLEREAHRHGGNPEFSYVFPEPLGPQRWRGVTREGGSYTLHLIHPLRGKLEERGRIGTAIGDPDVERARASPLGRRLERFFKAPVWQVRRDWGGDGELGGAPGGGSPGGGLPGGGSPGGGLPGGGPPGDGVAEARVFDLRFRTLLLRREAVFTYAFLVHPDGRVADVTRNLTRLPPSAPP